MSTFGLQLTLESVSPALRWDECLSPSRCATETTVPGRERNKTFGVCGENVRGVSGCGYLVAVLFFC